MPPSLPWKFRSAERERERERESEEEKEREKDGEGKGPHPWRSNGVSNASPRLGWLQFPSATLP